jgi:hypothetical protein
MRGDGHLVRLRAAALQGAQSRDETVAVGSYNKNDQFNSLRERILDTRDIRPFVVVGQCEPNDIKHEMARLQNDQEICKLYRQLPMSAVCVVIDKKLFSAIGIDSTIPVSIE